MTMQVQYSLWEAKQARLAEQIQVQRLDIVTA